MSALQKQLVKFDWEDKQGFYVNSKGLHKNIEFIKDNKIEYIILNPLKGYELSNCDFLIKLPQIKKLDIVNPKIDISGVVHLKHLEDLYLNVSQKQKVDFSELNLRKINFEYQVGYSGFEHNINLMEIIVRKADETFLNENVYKNYVSLKRLEIVQSKTPESLIFLSNNSNLQGFEIHHCKSLIDLEALENHKDKLETLKITFSKKVINVETVSKLKKLKWLVFSNSVPISGAGLVDDLPNLEVLVVYGSSYFVDGDLRSLKDKFTHLSIENKKHYILK